MHRSVTQLLCLKNRKLNSFLLPFTRLMSLRPKETHLVEAKQEWEGVESPSHLHRAFSPLKLADEAKQSEAKCTSLCTLSAGDVMSKEHQQELRRWGRNQEYRSNHHRMVLFLPPPLAACRRILPVMEQAKQTSLEVEVNRRRLIPWQRDLDSSYSKQEVQQQQLTNSVVSISRNGRFSLCPYGGGTNLGGNALQTFQEARWTFSQCSGPRSSSV